MSNHHDALRNIRELRLSLAQGRAPLGLLLSAGCGVAVKDSAQPLIPDIAGMTAALESSLTSGSVRDAFAELTTCLTQDGTADPNVEQWLSRVRALREVAGSGTVRGLSRTDLDSLEGAITEGIVGLVDKKLPDGSTPFHNVAAWAGAMEREQPVEIFTTNYDLLLEEAFESQRSPYFDGFVGTREPFFDNASVSYADASPLPARFTRLWKLHGSINWWEADAGKVTRSQVEAGTRRLIHPSHLKYDESRQMPFLALQDRLRAFLEQRGARLITCGYSFRDNHINATLRDGLQANPTASLIGLLYDALDDYDRAPRLAGEQCGTLIGLRLANATDRQQIVGAASETSKGCWRISRSCALVRRSSSGRRSACRCRSRSIGSRLKVAQTATTPSSSPLPRSQGPGRDPDFPTPISTRWQPHGGHRTLAALERRPRQWNGIPLDRATSSASATTPTPRSCRWSSRVGRSTSTPGSPKRRTTSCWPRSRSGDTSTPTCDTAIRICGFRRVGRPSGRPQGEPRPTAPRLTARL